MRTAFVILLAGAFMPGIQTSAEDTGAALLAAASKYPSEGFEMHAEVTVVKAVANGAANVELRTTGPWLKLPGLIDTGKRPARAFEWSWPAGKGPVPVAVGMQVDLRVSPAFEVQRVAYTLDETGAQRRKADGSWEFVVCPATTSPRKILLRVEPRAFQDNPTELRWTKPHGLLIASFLDGEYGADESAELETAAMRKLGWPIDNEPGKRVLPGRDGWQRWFYYFGQSTRKEANPRWLATQVLESQRLPTEPRLAE